MMFESGSHNKVSDLFFKELFEADTNVIQDVPVPITKGSMLIRKYRKDIFEAFPLDTKESRLKFLMWCVTSGSKQCTFFSYYTEIFEILNSPSSAVVQDASSPITVGMLILRDVEPDAAKIYPIDSQHDRQEFLNWCLRVEAVENSFLHDLKKWVSNERKNKDILLTKKSDDKGINIVGFINNQLGIGEDARMSALVMQSLQFPFSVFEPPVQINTGRFNSQIQGDNKKYRTNLICLPAKDTLWLLFNEPDQFVNCYNIGACQWELSKWPSIFIDYFDFINEIWAISHFAESVFKRYTDKPVIYMPMCVEYPFVEYIPRVRYKLPEKKFLFLVMFDGNSYLTRKNPVAAVHAFLKAFPKNVNVGLVIKAMNVNSINQMWQEILKIASHDNRIIIINESFSRAEVMGLIQACDAYVSLHRSEGFGRIMAEALLLKKPVISTNYSGNIDFTTSETAFMVDGEIIPLKEGDYFDWDGQYWCDPDIDIAAKKMLSCYENEALRNKLAENGFRLISTQYSSQSVGKAYRKRLAELNLI